MREIDGKIGEFVERKVTAEDQLKRIDIRAPQDGTVFQSNVHTVGGVITAGDAIMMIVPEADNLTVEAKVNPQDIDQVQVGQTALVALFRLQPAHHAGNLWHGHPHLGRHHDRPAHRPELLHHPHRHAAEEVARLGDVKLVPGMPVEAFVQTGERTVMSYLVKPLSRSIHARVPRKMTGGVALRPLAGDLP